MKHSDAKEDKKMMKSLKKKGKYQLKKIVKKKSVYDPFKTKSLKLQEFFYARNSSTDAIESKFSILPSKEGRKFYMKNGVYTYPEWAISKMLKAFQDTTNSLCGTKALARLPK